MPLYRVRFAVSRPAGPVSVGHTVAADLPRRGEVVTLCEAENADYPVGHARPLARVSYLVEQVSREYPLDRGASRQPEVSDATVYLSLLDAAGVVVPQEYGVIPGLVVRREAPLASGSVPVPVPESP